MKKVFKVAVTYSCYGTVPIEAESVEEAIKYAEDNIDELPLPDNAGYVDGSYEISSQDTLAIN